VKRKGDEQHGQDGQDGQDYGSRLTLRYSFVGDNCD
jgi:hypothetical protein